MHSARPAGAVAGEGLGDLGVQVEAADGRQALARQHHGLLADALDVGLHLLRLGLAGPQGQAVLVQLLDLHPRPCQRDLPY